jgi:hypothetical protein
MLEAQVSGDLTDFDIKHFCDGDPICCYYFRLPQLQKAAENTSGPEEKLLLSLTPNEPNMQQRSLTSLKALLLKRDESL